MSGSGHQAIPVVREWSGDHPKCLLVVGRPPGCPGVVEMPSRMFIRGREATRMSGSNREVLPVVREWSVGPP